MNGTSITLPWLLLLAVSSAAAETIFTVGADRTSCDHATIAAAVAAIAPGAAGVIRIANDQRYDGVVLKNDGRPLAFEGGFPDCIAARLSAAETGMVGDIRTVISGEAQMSGPRIPVYLSRIELRLSAPLEVSGPAELILQHSEVRAAAGTGVDLRCRDATVLLFDSVMAVRSVAGHGCVLAGGR